MDDRALVREAGMLLARLAPYVAAQIELFGARDLVRCAVYRGIGPHRAAGNARRLAAACEQARRVLGELLRGVCPSCRVVAEFTPIGDQEDDRGGSFPLATCRACRSTISPGDVLVISGA